MPLPKTSARRAIAPEEKKSQHPWIEKSWTQGPPIVASFSTREGTVERISLNKGKKFTCRISEHSLKDPILEWMEQYSKGEEGKKLPCNLSGLTPFTIKGLQAVQAIPFGQVTSYGEIASLLGSENGGRAVGNVCNKNPFPLLIPCHRVIAARAHLGGFAYPIEIKKLLLHFEGAIQKL